MKKLENKVAVVTGASKGIGAGIAKTLAAAGAAVIVNYANSVDDAEKIVAEIAAAGGKALAVQADVTKKADVERLFEETRAAFGEVSILVNNAGIYEFSPIEEITEEHYHSQFNINVLGLLLVTQNAVKNFDKNGGSIINISSFVTRTLPINSAVYTATKGAVDGITQVLSKELGPRNIRVNSINPGLIETEGTHAGGVIGSDFHKEMASLAPLGRIGVPDDLSPIALFLASDDSGWLTGETIIASGGSR